MLNILLELFFWIKITVFSLLYYKLLHKLNERFFNVMQDIIMLLSANIGFIIIVIELFYGV